MKYSDVITGTVDVGDVVVTLVDKRLYELYIESELERKGSPGTIIPETEHLESED